MKNKTISLISQAACMLMAMLMAAGLLRAEGRLGQAVHARHAVFELILAALRDLAAELRLGEQLAAEGHGVALAVADDAVDVVGMAQ